MKNKNRLARRLALAAAATSLALVGAATGPSQETASAAGPPHWETTEIYGGLGGLAVNVRWCSGGTQVLQPGTKTTKNICGFYHGSRSEMGVKVVETGTVLYNHIKCEGTPGEWRTLTTSSDTSRTAYVTNQRPRWC